MRDYWINMEDMGEGGFDDERITHHVTWSLKLQALIGHKHKQHVVIHVPYVRGLRALPAPCT